jgi:hypothetical protein
MPVFCLSLVSLWSLFDLSLIRQGYLVEAVFADTVVNMTWLADCKRYYGGVVKVFISIGLY